ncbi:MAG: response regulator [Spirochaetota bacterium]
MPEKIYTTYQIGKFCQVNIRTVIRWIETGKLKAYATPGGHRRVKWSDLIQFLTQNRMPIPKELEEARKKKLLVVDNDPEFLSSASNVIKNISDVEMRTTGSGFDAGMIITEWIPDLILLSFLMPDLDGFDAIKRIKANPKLKKISIIALTPKTDPQTLEKVKKSGADTIIIKPIEDEVLLKKIDKFLYSLSRS